MTVSRLNLLWKSFKGIRSLNSINSDTELGADICMNVRLSKEKSGQNRSIKSSGWFNNYATLPEPVISLFSASLSGYSFPNQLIAFTKSATNINAWIVEDDSGILAEPVQIAEFPIAEDVYDCCMTQWGDRMSVVIAFGNNTLGFITYSATDLSDGYGWLKMSDNWYYTLENIIESTTTHAVQQIRSIHPYNARLAINGYTQYSESDDKGGQKIETIYGVWCSEAGQPLNFTADLLTSATDTSAFFVETGEYVNKLVGYSGLVAFCQNRSYNIHGTSQNDIVCTPLTSKGVIGNAAFVLNGQCAYVDDFAHNAFVLKGNLDDTIGFDGPIGDDIQNYLRNVKNVTINAAGRRVRMTTESGVSLVYDVDVGEWTTDKLNAGARVVTFLDKEIMCDGTDTLHQITDEWTPSSQQKPNEDGYYSHYKTNLIWLDSQSSVKSHIYPFAIILEPNTNNDFFVRFTTDRGQTFQGRITKAGFAEAATYSIDDTVPANGSKFVDSDDDLSGRVFLASGKSDLLVTVDRPPFWRYLQIEIYTTSPSMQFNIAGIEAKNTFIDDEQLDY